MVAIQAMTHAIRFARFFSLLTMAILLAACRTPGDQFAGMDDDFVLGTPLPDRVPGANFFADGVVKGQFPPVYFAFDRFDVSSAEMPKVRDLATAMRQVPNDIIIAGFTDERGTEEYNRGLGERRAQAVRSALIGLGIDGGRIQTVSFGQEMPADPASNEAAWSKNRRAEFGVIR